MKLQRPGWATSVAHSFEYLALIKHALLGSCRLILSRILPLRIPERQLCWRCSVLTYVYSRATPRESTQSLYRFYDACIEYGRYEDIASRKNCHFCRFILQSRSAQLEVVPARTQNVFDLQFSDDKILVQPRFEQRSPDRLPNTEWYGWLDPSLNPEICDRLGRMGDGSVLDPEFVKSWLQQCDRSHDHGKDWVNRKNQRGYEGLEPFAFMVIDVEEDRLVQVNYPARYIALSYVWGLPSIRPDLETTSSLLPFLTQHGAFSETSEVLTVVKDAMDFVRLVGERYLWVDRFCIIQDDDEMRNHWIRRMDEIYANAYFTTIAASGENSNCPLPGVRPSTRRQQTSEPAETLRLKNKSDYRYEYRSDFVGATVDNYRAYAQRGWTFQEQYLSPRRVVFTDSEVICECSQSGQAELHLGLSLHYDTTTPNPFSRLDAAEEGFLASADERMSDPEGEPEWLYTAHGAGQMAYQDLVEQYTKRKFSCELDILNAFMGALSRVASMTGWGFTYGIPGTELGIALYWVPPSPRRLVSRTTTENTADTCMA